MELLLDETLCQGEIHIPQELVRRAGGINKRLRAKQKYELVLRIAQEMPIAFEEIKGGNAIDNSCVDVETTMDEHDVGNMLILRDDTDASEGWQTDCYVVGKYSEQLRECGYFEVVIESLLGEAMQEGRYQQTLEYLEQMIGRVKAFYDIDDATRPILIYKGDAVCHNLLTVFAEQFGHALEAKGELVTYFDVVQEELGNVTRFLGQHFKAVVGFQTYMYKIKVSDGTSDIHDQIYGPKFNFIFDHPVWAKPYLAHEFPDFHVLTHDANYVAFIRKYYQKDAILFPPAGMMAEQIAEGEREYNLSFVGAIGDYWNEVLLIHQMEREKRFLANRFLLKMRREPNLTAEEALEEVLRDCGKTLAEQEFFELLYEFRRVIYCATHYHRRRVLQRILEGGIRVDVFGSSWLGSDLRKYPNLVCHGDVTIEESLEIWQKSKLSLNVMSWHKGGFTERMANIMLAGAVLVTDDTTYLKGKYDENDMLVFRLDELECLPEQINKLLEDDEKRQRMAQNGLEKTKREHTWEKRAEQFLALLSD